MESVEKLLDSRIVGHDAASPLAGVGQHAAQQIASDASISKPSQS
jgi:hypothetical protein